MKNFILEYGIYMMLFLSLIPFIYCLYHYLKYKNIHIKTKNKIFLTTVAIITLSATILLTIYKMYEDNREINKFFIDNIEIISSNDSYINKSNLLETKYKKIEEKFSKVQKEFLKIEYDNLKDLLYIKEQMEQKLAKTNISKNEKDKILKDHSEEMNKINEFYDKKRNEEFTYYLRSNMIYYIFIILPFIVIVNPFISVKTYVNTKITNTKNSFKDILAKQKYLTIKDKIALMIKINKEKKIDKEDIISYNTNLNEIIDNIMNLEKIKKDILNNGNKTKVENYLSNKITRILANIDIKDNEKDEIIENMKLRVSDFIKEYEEEKKENEYLLKEFKVELRQPHKFRDKNYLINLKNHKKSHKT